MTQGTLDAFQRLNDILDTLRRECPWDRVQTLGSLRYLTIEEVYELSEAVLAVESEKLKDGNNLNATANSLNTQLKKELGDLFMHHLQ